MGDSSVRRGDTVILAAGDFPRRGGKAWRLLEGAKRVVACDSAADAYRRRFGRWPTVAVGDMDSAKAAAVAASGCHVVRMEGQDDNDLAKAVVHCRSEGWKNPVILGACGKREDHMIGNVFRALDFGLEVVTDFGRFVPFCGAKTFRVRRGASISVFAPDSATRMTSRGLEWPLDRLSFANLYCATLNRAVSSRVSLTADRPVSVYVALDG